MTKDMSESDEISAYAKHILATKRGVGMTPPFYAETASVRGDKNWPLWIVRNKTCNSMAQFYTRSFAERLADEMNRQVGAAKDQQKGQG